MTDKEQPLHSAQSGDSLSTVARARTLTVLGRLDSGRKRSVLQFLYESRLIDREQALLHESDLIERQHNIVSLRGADLSGADLSGASENSYDLSGANLSGANLIDADLRESILIDAILIAADLSGADLSRANLSGADLFRADLRRTKRITNEQLSAAESLEGATMPDGQTLRGEKTPNGPTFEEWLKSKGRRR